MYYFNIAKVNKMNPYNCLDNFKNFSHENLEKMFDKYNEQCLTIAAELNWNSEMLSTQRCILEKKKEQALNILRSLKLGEKSVPHTLRSLEQRRESVPHTSCSLEQRRESVPHTSCSLEQKKESAPHTSSSLENKHVRGNISGNSLIKKIDETKNLRIAILLRNTFYLLDK